MSILIAILSSSWPSSAQTSLLPEVKMNEYFKEFTVDDGLPNQTVNCFAEDDQGFIWIGTLNGLSKFNGETFINFHNSEDSLSLHNDEINEIIVDHNRLWIGTAEGLALMDIATEAFTYFHLPDSEGISQNIESMIRIQDQLWIGYESNSNQKGGIGVFSLTESRFIKTIGDEYGVNNVHELYHDPLDHNLLWIASSDLYSYNMASEVVKKHESPYAFAPLRRGCTSILRLDTDQLLVSTTRYGLLHYNTQTLQWSEPILYNQGKSLTFFSPNYIKLMTQVDEDRIFLNTYDLGLVIYYHKTNQFSRFQVAEDDPFAIPSYRSHRTYKDKTGRLWHGFYTHFSVVIDQLQMVSLQSTDAPGNISIPIVTDKGIEFISENQHCLQTENRKTKKINGLTKPWNYAQQDARGNSYYLYSDALYVKKNSGQRPIKVVDKNIIPGDDDTRRVLKYFSIDNDNQVWITTGIGAVIVYHPENGTRVIPIKNERIGICTGTPEASYRVAHGPQETLISHACGILIYNAEEDVLIDINDYMESPIWEAERWTYTIAHLTEQVYIIGSFRQGLHILDLAAKQSYAVSPSLDDIIISSITTTSETTAWCVTDAGLLYYDHSQSYFRLITTDDGLPSDYLIFQRAVPVDESSLVLGGNKNLIFIDTERIKNRRSASPPIITSVIVNDQPVINNFYLRNKETIHLGHEQNDLEIRFSHLTSFDGEATNFFYQMVGLSDSWVDSRQTDHVRFFDLDPGQYSFNLASSSPITESTDIASVTLHIASPVWATSWFRILMTLGISSLLYYLYTARITQIRSLALLEQEEKENDQLKSQNELIQKQNKELQSLNQSKDKFFSILAHDLRAPLAAFSGLGKQLNYHIERKNFKKIEILSDHIQQSSEKLTGLVDNLLNWSLVQTGRFEYQAESISLAEVIATIVGQLQDVINQKDITITRKVKPQSIVLADTQSVHIIVRNLLSNAIKFSHPGDQIVVLSEHTEEQVQLKIIDQGIGISTDQIDLVMSDTIHSSPGTSGELGVGLGLQMCRELIKMNKGILKIEPNEHQGTTVIISLPIENEI